MQGFAVKASEGRNRFIILVLADDVEMNKLPEEMQACIKTRQFVDFRNIQTKRDIEQARKRLLFAMPRVPIRQLQAERLGAMNFLPLYHRLGKYTQYNQRHGVKQHNMPIYFDSDAEEEETNIDDVSTEDDEETQHNDNDQRVQVNVVVHQEDEDKG